MKPFCILKAVLGVSVAFVFQSSFAIAQTQEGRQPASPLLVNLVTETLAQGLAAQEIRPVPEHDPACLAISGSAGTDGQLIISPQARLLTVDNDAPENTMRELSVKFGSSGLKIGPELIRLVSDLDWQGQQRGVVIMPLTFECGPYLDFYKDGLRLRQGVKLGLFGGELCVAG